MILMGRYLETELELIKFHQNILKNPGLTNFPFENLKSEKVFGIFKNNEIIGGWVEEAPPFSRTLNNIPENERLDQLSKQNIELNDALFMTSFHLNKSKSNSLASILLVWHSLRAPKYSGKKYTIFNCYQPRLFDKFLSAGAKLIDSRESVHKPGIEELILYYEVSQSFTNFLK